MSVPATTLNKACLSGVAAIAQAAQQVATGQSEVVVAGGMESMSNAPHLLPGARRGTRYGAAVLMDALDRDALICGFEGISMGAATDRDQARFGITRRDQDAFAAESHTRAAAAIKAGRLAEEIVPVTVSGRGRDVLVEDDEGCGRTPPERLAALPPAFSEGRRPSPRDRPPSCPTAPARWSSWTPSGPPRLGLAGAGRDRRLRHRRRTRYLAAAAARQRHPRRPAPRRDPRARATST